SRAAFNSTSISQPSFTVDVAGAYTVRLVVTDSAGHESAPQTLTLTSSQCGGAIPQVTSITASPVQPDTGQVIQLQASIGDADQISPCNLTPSYVYAWQLVAQPAGSQARLNNPVASDPSFTPDVPGNYEVALTVSKVDLSGSSSAADAGSGGTDAGTSDAGAAAGTSVALANPIASPMATQSFLVSTCGAAAPTIVASSASATVATGGLVALSATPSDADSQAPCDLPVNLTYAWSLTSIPAGSHAAMNNATAIDPSFVADTPGVYVAQVVVTDQHGRQGISAPVTVTATSCGAVLPEVSITPSQSATNPGTPVQLSAVVVDPNATGSCSLAEGEAYAWSFLSLPPGSLTQINDPSIADPSFTPDIPGSYSLQVAATDSSGQTGTASVQIQVGTCGTLAPQIAFTISPGPAVNAGTLVQVAAQVTDPNASATCGLTENESYSWSFLSLPAGSRAALANPSISNPSFVTDLPGQYQLQLTVANSSGQRTTLATGVITAGSCGSNLPVVSALAANPTAPNVGQATQLAATIVDADNAGDCGLGRTFTYRWTVTGLPKGSQSKLNDPTSFDPSFVPDVPGEYSFTLVVTDNLGRASTPGGPLTVIAAACGSIVPVATASASNASPDTFQTVQLTASVTDGNQTCDTAAGNFSYRWTLTALPLGSKTTLNNPLAQNPSFVADAPGTYTGTLVVTDGLGLASAPTSTSIIASACGSAPATPIAEASYTECSSGTVVSGTCAATNASPPNSATNPCVVSSATGCGLGGSGAALVQLQADPSFDSDNQSPCNLTETLSYHWLIFELPAGSQATLFPGGAASSARDPWLQVDQKGLYVVQLYVEDGTAAVVNPPVNFYIQAN
ncbi:MAG: PKD domain-containing protein, partial [Deltaproteobacteria bacterium]